MKTFLKVKVGTLAAEIRIIKTQLRHWRGDHPMRAQLKNHVKPLQSEVRSAGLAYGFLRGRPYEQMEILRYFPPDWERVEYHVEKFCGGYHKGVKIDTRIVMQQFAAWLHAAKEKSNSATCVTLRDLRDLRCANRRVAYHKRFTRPNPTDQKALKEQLKAKWEGAKKLST